jgi:multidrug efflux system outer membrane protein
MRIPAALVLLLAAVGCTLGPDPGRAPLSAADDAASYVNHVPADDAAPAVNRWWLSFADPVTNELVELALSQNTDLMAAAARLQEAEAGLRAARGARWPQASAGLSGTRSKSSFVLPSVGRIGIYSTTFAGDLTISYQLDLFGRLARSQQAAWGELMATEASLQAVQHTIIAEVVRARVRVAQLERQLQLARKTADSWQTTATFVDGRYRLGLVDAAELHLNRQSLAAAEAAVPGLEQSLAAARTALDLLVGRRPGTGDELPRTLPVVPSLQPAPVGLPADLLDRRPDLIEARMRFSAATARVGVALANLYPSLTLTGSSGSRSDSLGDLIASDGLVYSAIAGLAAPVFAGGQLRAEVAASRARSEQAAAAYAGAVLRALKEVEDALVAEDALRRQLAAQQVQLESAVAAEELARSRYQNGTGEILQLLIADRARTTAEVALIGAQASQWEARIALLLALGGDWLAEPQPSTEAS